MPQPDLKKYEFIDALRGIAILAVMLVHSSQSVSPTSTTLQGLMDEGARGVQLFYIASAVTLCMSWISRSQFEQAPIRNFFIRRFFRIAPLFYIAIVFYSYLYAGGSDYWSPHGIKWWYAPLTALFLHGFHPETINSVVPGGWSIATEVGFYLILPILLTYIKSIKICLGFFSFSLVLYYLNKLIVPQLFVYPENQQYLVNNFAYFDFLGQLPVFFIGIFCYLILRNNYPRPLIAIMGGALMCMLLVLFFYPSAKLPPHHLIAGGLFSILTVLLANWPTRLLVNKITRLLGKLSFSLYLVHPAVLKYFHTLGISGLFPHSNAASLLHYVCVIVVACCVSWYSYQYIEKTGIVLGKRLIDNLEAKRKVYGTEQ